MAPCKHWMNAIVDWFKAGFSRVHPEGAAKPYLATHWFIT